MGWTNKLHGCNIPEVHNGYINEEYFTYDSKRVGDGSTWVCDECLKVWVVREGTLVDSDTLKDVLLPAVRLTEAQIQAIQDATGFPEGEDG